MQEVMRGFGGTHLHGVFDRGTSSYVPIHLRTVTDAAVTELIAGLEGGDVSLTPVAHTKKNKTKSVTISPLFRSGST